MNFDWAALSAALPDLLQGLRLTLLIALTGLAGGVALGVIAGVTLTYGSQAAAFPAQMYVALIRGTPIVVQHKGFTSSYDNSRHAILWSSSISK